MALGVVGHDPGDERLEVGIPPELGGINLPVRHHDPAQVAGLTEWSNHSARDASHGWPLSELLKRLFQ
jgi:hypothetical protein